MPRLRLGLRWAAALLLCAAAGEGDGLQQVLVFDAGSSGTRVHVFNLRSSPGAHVPEVDQSVRGAQTLKIKPGLSHFAQTDPEGARAGIRELLAFADRFVQAPRRSATPTLVKATAGLRAVPADKAGAVLEVVRQVLGESGYQSQRSWVDIIPGREEGGLAWVAANYLAGTFGAEAESSGSLGVIEMGGGSTQVTFEVEEGFPLDPQDRYVFTTALGRRHKVYAHSYLGYGQDHAQARMRATQRSEDPCYPVGYKYEQKGSPGSFVQGVGRADACEDAIEKELLSARAADSPGRYPSEPPLRGRFVATENFFYTRNDLHMSLLGDRASMETAAKDACAATTTPAPAPGEAPKHCFALSFQAAFLEALLRKAAGEGTAGAPATVEIAHQIRGGDLDWALGAAVVHALAAARLATGSAADSVDDLPELDGHLNNGMSETSAALCMGFAALAALVLLLRAVGGPARLRALLAELGPPKSQ